MVETWLSFFMMSLMLTRSSSGKVQHGFMVAIAGIPFAINGKSMSVFPGLNELDCGQESSQFHRGNGVEAKNKDVLLSGRVYATGGEEELTPLLLLL